MDEAMIRKRCEEMVEKCFQVAWAHQLPPKREQLVVDLMALHRATYADGLKRAAKIAETPMGPLLSDFDDHWGPRIAKQIRQHAKEMGHE